MIVYNILEHSHYSVQRLRRQHTSASTAAHIAKIAAADSICQHGRIALDILLFLVLDT